MAAGAMSGKSPPPGAPPACSDDVLLRVENLVKYFPAGTTRLVRKRDYVHAVRRREHDGAARADVRRGR